MIFPLSARPSAVGLAKVALPQPNVLRRDLDELVVLDELHGLLETEPQGRREQHVVVPPGRADVGELLGFHGIDGQVAAARVNSDDLAFVDVLTRTDHELSPLLQVEQRVAE